MNKCGFIFYASLALAIALFIAGGILLHDGDRDFDQNKKQQGIIMLSIGGVLAFFDLIVGVASIQQRISFENKNNNEYLGKLRDPPGPPKNRPTPVKRNTQGETYMWIDLFFRMFF